MLKRMYSSKKEHLTPAQRAAQDERQEDDKRNGHFLATEHTNLPLDGFMTRLMAEELPILTPPHAAGFMKFCAATRDQKSPHKSSYLMKSATSWICINER